MKQTKSRLLATLLSILLPGVGQLYKKQNFKTIFGYSIFFIFLILFILFKLQLHFWGITSLIIFIFCLYLLNIFDALVSSFQPLQLKKWFLIIPLILLSINAFAAKNNMIGIRAYNIISGSMIPTIQIGDFLVTDMNHYKNNQISNGELIAFQHENFKLIIKRVIALPGDTIEVRNDTTLINNKRVNESFAYFLSKNSNPDNFNIKHKNTDFKSTVVPENKIFVMGDNRDNSFDSRDPEFGFVDINQVKGKPIYIYWANDKSRIGKKLE